MVDYGLLKLQFQHSSGKVRRTIRTTSLAQLSKQLPMCCKQQPFLFTYSTDTYVGFALLTVVTMKSSIFWDKSPCSLVKVNKCFEREISCLPYSLTEKMGAYVPPRHRLIFTRQQNVISQNRELFHSTNTAFSCYT